MLGECCDKVWEARRQKNDNVLQICETIPHTKRQKNDNVSTMLKGADDNVGRVRRQCCDKVSDKKKKQCLANLDAWPRPPATKFRQNNDKVLRMQNGASDNVGRKKTKFGKPTTLPRQSLRQSFEKLRQSLPAPRQSCDKVSPIPKQPPRQ